MEEYRIGAVANITGLSVHNLRAWEKRHNAFDTDRTDSGRRVFSEQTLTRIKLLKDCVDNGMGISTIAHLSNQELLKALEKFSKKLHESATSTKLSAFLVNVQLSPTLKSQLEKHLALSEASFYNTIEALPSDDSSSVVDLLIVEMPTLSAQDSQHLGLQLKRVKAKQKILIYRYARQQDITYLRTLGTITMKAPVVPEELLAVIKQRYKPVLVDASFATSTTIPARVFSDIDIHKASSLTSSIDCECPQHMAELIKSLIAFESYSSQCQNSDQAAADLHRFIQQRTAYARMIMENLLQTVLQQEGIDLELIAV